MTNSLWVTLLHLFARQTHWLCVIPWLTASEWHCFICLSCSLINHVASYDQQFVSDTTSFICQAGSSIMLHPMTNSKWVKLLHFFARQAHASCCIPWPTASEWHCLMCLPGRLINHVACHDQQFVSDTQGASFVCQALSSIMLHPMTNSKVSDTTSFLCPAFSSIMLHHMANSLWATLLRFFAR